MSAMGRWRSPPHLPNQAFASFVRMSSDLEVRSPPRKLAVRLVDA